MDGQMDGWTDTARRGWTWLGSSVLACSISSGTERDVHWDPALSTGDSCGWMSLGAGGTCLSPADRRMDMAGYGWTQLDSTIFAHSISECPPGQSRGLVWVD